jgi:manganese/zinc/iron transport system substrate-binding protein
VLIMMGQGCSPVKKEARDPSAPYTAVATVGMLADVLREVAGDRAQVSSLMGSGVDPHLYNPTRGDVAALMKGDIVFYAGHHLEGKMGTVLARLSASRPVIAVCEAIDPAQWLEVDEGEVDPHLWMDASTWALTASVMADALSAFDPDHADAYAERARLYQAKLAELHQYAQRAIESIPLNQRLLVTAHDAFGYFGRAYHLEVLGIQGLSTESEAGLRDINRLVDLIVERKVPAVFVETSVAEKNVRALIEGARSRGHTVEIGGTLFSDAMGPEGEHTGTYIGMLEHNINTITTALGGLLPTSDLQEQQP